MDLRLALAGVLIVGYVAYKGFERSGGKLPFSLTVGMGRRRSVPARKPPAPDKLEYERVTLDATPANLPSFIRLTGNLERLGFRLVADYAIAGWPDTYCRGLVHKEKPVHAAIVERQGLPAHVELFTLFDDFSALVTGNSEEADDPTKPPSLRVQQIPGLTLDELFVQHLSSLESLFQDQLHSLPATRLTYFEHQRALLVVEHELRKAKRIVRSDSLSRVLDALPELPVAALLKRYGLAEPAAEEAPKVEAPAVALKTVPSLAAEAKADPEEAPKRWGIGSSLLSKRLASKQEGDTAGEDGTPSGGGETMVLAPEVPKAPIVRSDEPLTLEVTVEEAAPVFDLAAEPAAEANVVELDEPDATDSLPFAILPEEPESALEPEAAAPLPFEIVPEPEAAAPLPFEIVPEPEAVAPLPFEVVPEPEAAAPLPFEIVPADEAPEPEPIAAAPAIKLPFEIAPEEKPAVAEVEVPAIALPFESPAAIEAAASPSAKPTCPHCGATLFSSLSSRCSKCKQAVR